MIRRFFLVILTVSSMTVLFGQNPTVSPAPVDTSIVVRENARAELFTEISDLNPKRAAFLSAMLPGMGQVYNRQYWKLPFIYGGAVIIGHYIKYQDRLYRSFRSAYLSNPEDRADIYSQTSEAVLERNALQLRRDRDYLMIIGGLFYLLQIADAHISAHLHEFQINEDLSMNIGPSIKPTALISRSVGVSVTLNFR